MKSDGAVTATRSRVELDIIIGAFPSKRAVVTRSINNPGAVLCSTQGSFVAVDGVAVQLRPDAFRLFIALLALRGRPLERYEVEDLLWGDRADGGPAGGVVDQLLMQCRAAAVAIGYRIESRWGQGWSAIPRLSTDAMQAAE